MPNPPKNGPARLCDDFYDYPQHLGSGSIGFLSNDTPPPFAPKKAPLGFAAQGQAKGGKPCPPKKRK